MGFENVPTADHVAGCEVLEGETLHADAGCVDLNDVAR